MKRILLATCAVLALSGAADARSRGVGLPTDYLGGWCKTSSSSPADTHYESSKVEDCNDEFLTITRTGLESLEYGWRCVFVNIKRGVRHTGLGNEPGNEWRVQTHCTSETDYPFERRDLTMRADSGYLFIWDHFYDPQSNGAK